MNNTILSKQFAAAFVFSIAVALSLSGCSAVSGPQGLDDFGKYLDLTPGTSTKMDIFEKFGQPSDVVYQASASSMWAYYNVFTRGSALLLIPVVGIFAQGEHRTTRTARFSFDSNGRLLQINTSKVSQYHNNWAELARIANKSDTKSTRVAQEMWRLGKPFDRKLANELALYPSLEENAVPASTLTDKTPATETLSQSFGTSESSTENVSSQKPQGSTLIQESPRIGMRVETSAKKENPARARKATGKLPFAVRRRSQSSIIEAVY